MHPSNAPWRAPAIIRAGSGVAVPIPPGGVRLAPGLILVTSDPTDWLDEPDRAPDVAVAVHGSGVVDGRFVRHRDHLQAVLEAHPTWTPDQLGSTIRGVLTAYVWRRAERTIEVLPDPWGGLVHRYAADGIEIVSSDLGRMVEVLTALGRCPSKSLPFAAEVASLGSGGFEPSSYAGLEVLDVFEYLRISQRAVSVHRYGLAAELITPFPSYREGLDAARTEIETNLRAVVAAASAGGLGLIGHLTGGADTRLVLAVTAALGLTDAVRYLCMGPRSSSDHLIADRLAVEFGLLMTDNQGISVLRPPRTPIERALWPMRNSFGLAPGGPAEHLRGTHTIVLSGGFGGFLKGNYSARLPADQLGSRREDSAGAARAVFGAKAFSPAPGDALVTPGQVERRIDRFHALRTAAGELGLSPSAALDWMFIQVRNRYFVAETTRLWNAHVSRFDPLYCIAGARLALSLPVRERSVSRVQFDLMRSWTPRLLELPFDRPRVSPEYQALSGQVQFREFRNPAQEPRDDGHPGPIPFPPADVAPAPAALIERARAMDIPLRMLRDLEDAREIVRSAMSRIPEQERWEVLNRRVVHRLLTSSLTHRGPVRQVHNLAAALLWYTDRQPAQRGTAPAASRPRPFSPIGARTVLWHLRHGGPRQARAAWRRLR